MDPLQFRLDFSCTDILLNIALAKVMSINSKYHETAGIDEAGIG
jgi:hypothetical protein